MAVFMRVFHAPSGWEHQAVVFKATGSCLSTLKVSEEYRLHSGRREAQVPPTTEYSSLG